MTPALVLEFQAYCFMIFDEAPSAIFAGQA
jgi:hypothetical protein